MNTPRTDQRIELLKAGHSKHLPKWEDFARELEDELERLKKEHDSVTREFQHRFLFIAKTAVEASYYPENQ